MDDVEADGVNVNADGVDVTKNGADDSGAEVEDVLILSVSSFSSVFLFFSLSLFCLSFSSLLLFLPFMNSTPIRSDFASPSPRMLSWTADAF